MKGKSQLLFTLQAIVLAVTKDNYQDSIQQGYTVLTKLHDLGLTQAQVYQPLLQYHNGLEEGLSRDCLADILDFVVGWCAPQWHIWRNDDRA